MFSQEKLEQHYPIPVIQHLLKVHIHIHQVHFLQLSYLSKHLLETANQSFYL